VLRLGLYDAYRGWHKPKRQRRVAALLAKYHTIGASEAQVERHMAMHERVLDQPSLSAKGVGKRMEQAQVWLDRDPERRWAIVELLARQRVATLRQLAELLYEQSEPEDGAAEQATRRLLGVMHYGYVAQRVAMPGGRMRLRHRGSADAVYTLGPVGAALWAARYQDLPQELRPKVARGQNGIRANVMYHDLSTQDCLWVLRRSATASVQRLGSGEVLATVATENWWASDYLGWRVNVPAYRNEYGERRPAAQRTMFSDALLAVGVRLLHRRGEAAPSTHDPRRDFLLPLLIEYDTGSRVLYEAVEQHLRYLHLSTSEVVGQRFPQLAIPGYQLPVLEICEGLTGATGKETDQTGWGRARNIQREVRELASARGFTTRPPIFFTTRHALYAEGLQAKVMPMWTDPEAPLAEVCLPLLEALAASAKASLVASGTLSSNSRLLPLPREAAPGYGTTEDPDAMLTRTERRAKRERMDEARKQLEEHARSETVAEEVAA
jgi:hypothetical protein